MKRRSLVLVLAVLGITALDGSPAPAQSPPLPTGVIALWHADASFTDSVGQNNLTAKGNVTFVPGRFGSAFNFDGTSLAEGPAGPGGANATLNVGGTFTVAAWINVQGVTGTAGNSPLVAKWGDGNTGTAGYGIFYTNSSVGVVGASNTGSDISRADAAVARGVWTHVAGVYTGSELRLYLNGKLAASTPFSGGVFANNVPILIGGYDPAYTASVSGHLIGAVDEAAIWNRALTDDEIQALAAPPGPPRIAFELVDQDLPAGSGDPTTYQSSGIDLSSVSFTFNGIAIAASRWTTADVTMNGVVIGKRISFQATQSEMDPSGNNVLRVSAKDVAGNPLGNLNTTLDYDANGK